jgi:hypothetical protein
MKKKYDRESKLEAEANRLNSSLAAGQKARFWVGVKEGAGEIGTIIEYVLASNTVLAFIRGESPPRRLRSVAASHVELIS